MFKIVSTSLMLACILLASENSDPKERAKAAMQSLGGTLKTELTAKMKEDPSGLKAVEFCSDAAQKLTKEVSQKMGEGSSVRRTALKVRNTSNQPSTQDIAVMEELKARIEKGEDPKSVMKVVQNDQTLVAYKALTVEKGCLKCHGSEQAIDPKVLSLINTKYPSDKARNFKEGDFRGGVVATIKGQ